MSISFNGLASGLDTSSWITSLTALKQAKVTTLQQQREELVVSKNALSSIRSFFTSFRSTLEKITDSRFNIVSMNLFAQNLATSANLNVLSATATSEAEEGKYEVKVDKIATNTQAVSKYEQTTTVKDVTKADKNTLLSKIGDGVKAGLIEVNVNGIFEEIYITSGDTIGSFIDKLRDKGYKADFNEKTGYFITNLTSDDVNDTGNTGIVQELHLTKKENGFKTDVLQKEEVATKEKTAELDTSIWDIKGMNASVKNTADVKDDHTDGDARSLKLKSGADEYWIVIDENETIGSLINDINNDAELQAKGVVASFENGIFKLINASIEDDGDTGFMTAFGLKPVQVTASSQQSDALTSKDLVTTVTAEGSTKLTALQGGEGITDSDTVVVEDENGVETTITLDSEMTIDGLLQAMRDAGLEASISDDGIVSISDGKITGGTVDIKALLGLTETIIPGQIGSTTATGSNQLLVSIPGVETTITGDATLGSIGINNTDTLSIVDASGQVIYSASELSELTVDELLALCSEQATNNGGTITGSLTNGVITLDSPSGYHIEGTIAEKLGLTTTGGEISTTTVGVTQSSKSVVVFATTATASTESTLADLGITAYELNVYEADGTRSNLYSMTFASDTNLQTVIDRLADAGINATLENGVLTINSSDDGRYIEGGFAQAIGITAQEYAGETVTTGNTLTSATPVTYLQEGIATGDSKLSDVLDDLTDEQIGALTLTKNGVSTITLNELIQGELGKNASDTTIDELVSVMNSVYIQASLSNDGRIVINNDNGVYITGTLADALGIGASSVVTSTTYAADQTSSAQVTYTNSVVVDGLTMIDETYTGNSIITVHTSETVCGMTDTSGLTSLSAVTASDMVSGRTYKISTTADLEKLATFVNTNDKTCSGVTFVMSNDIDLSSIDNWTAIGNLSTSFSGTFDGNGYEITGLTIDSSYDLQGLFGCTDGATIKNLGLTGVDITSAGFYVGALVGSADNSTIQNVYTEGSVSGSTTVGGLVGHAIGSILTSCQASGTVVGSNSYVGGLVGHIISGTITSSSSSANVSGKNLVGGIAGCASGATLISVYSTGTLDDTDNSYVHNTGGLVGHSENGLTIQDSWTKASVESGGGSVVGYVSSGTVLISNTQALSDNYYASMTVTATGTAENCSTITAEDTPFTITVKNDATSAITIDVTGMSIDGLFNALQDYTTGSITDGVISFNSTSGYYVTGDLMTAWGIGTQSAENGETIFNNQTSTSAVTYTTTANITGTTQIGKTYDLADNEIVVMSKDGQTAIGTVTITETMTFDTAFAKLGSLGVDATIDGNGVISLSSDDGHYITGGAVTAWGIDLTSTVETTTAVLDQTSSSEVQYVQTLTATGSTEISDFYTGNSTITVKTSTGENVGTVDISGMTVEEMFSALSSFGVTGTIDEDGVISFSSGDGNIVTGAPVEAWGITTSSVVTSATVAVDQTSTAQVTYTSTIAVDNTTEISDFYTGNSTITVKTSTGENVGTVDISGMTVDEMFSALSSFGVTGTIDEDGVISFTSAEGNIVTGAPVMAWGIRTSRTEITTTVAVDQTSTAQVTYTSTIAITGTDKISEAITLQTSTYTITGTINTDGSVTGGSVVAINSNVDWNAIKTGLASGNTYSGYTFVLNTDSVGGTSINGLGTVLNGTTIAFEGTIDGQGHKITLAGTSGGLFKYLNGTVKNLEVSGSISFSNGGMPGAVIADYMLGGTISACTSSASITGGGGTFVAGLVGRVDGNVRIENSLVKGTVTGNGASGAGGLVAWVNSGSLVVQNSSVESGVVSTSSSGYGGLVGRINSGATVSLADVLFSGTLASTATNAGGIAGTNNGTLYMTNCVATTSSSPGYAFVADNTGTVSATNCVTSNNVTFIGGSGTVSKDDFFYQSNLKYGALKVLGFGSQWVANNSASPQLNVGAVADNVITIKNNFDGIRSSFTVTETTTFDEMLTWINSNGLTATMEDGVITLSGAIAFRLDGELATQLGFASTYNTSTINNVLYTKSTAVPSSIMTGSTLTAAMYTLAQVNGTINSDGSISGGSIVAIKSAADLAAMVGQTYTGKHFILADDIELTGGNWRGINLVNSTFDGHGHTISGEIVTTADGSGNAGLFASIQNSKVQNLTFSGELINTGSAQNFGLIGSVGTSSTVANICLDFANIVSQVSVVSMGAIAGCAIGTLAGKVNFDNIEIKNTSISTPVNVTNFGGVVGLLSSGNVNNVYLHDSGIDILTFSAGAGGIVGTSGGAITVANTIVELDQFTIQNTTNVSGYAGLVFGRGSTNNNLINVQVSARNSDITNPYGAGSNASVSYLSRGTNISVFQQRLSNSPSSWYLDSSGELRLVAPGSNIVSVYNSQGSIISETVIATGIGNSMYTTGDLLGAVDSAITVNNLADGSVQLENNGNNGNYVKSNALEQLGIETIEGTYTTKTRSDNASNRLTKTENRTLTEDTTWGDLGVTGDLSCISLNGGSKAAVALSSTKTIEQTAAELAEYGITLKVENGIATFDYDNSTSGERYIIEYAGLNGYYEAMGALNITTDAHKTITTTRTYSNITEEVANSITVDKTLTEDTTWADLGVTGDSFQISLDDSGLVSEEIITTWTMSQTSEYLQENYGIQLNINNGFATIDYDNTGLGVLLAGEGYCSEMLDLLNIDSEPHHKETITTTTYFNETEDVYNSILVEHTLTDATTWEDLGIDTAEFNIELYNIADGTTTNVAISNTMTMTQTAGLLNGYGINMTIQDGKAIMDYTGNYVLSTTNTNVLNKLDLSTTNHYQTNETTIYENASSDAIKEEITNTILGTTTLDKLGFDEDDSSVWNIIDKTTGEIVTIEPTRGQSLDDLAGALSAYNIELSITNGKVSITNNGNYAIQSITGWGSAELGLPADASSWMTINNESTTYNTNSNTIKEEKTFTLTEDTTWKDLGVASDTVEAYCEKLDDDSDISLQIQSTWTMAQTADYLKDNYNIDLTINNGYATLDYDNSNYENVYIIAGDGVSVEMMYLLKIEAENLHTTVTTTTTWSNTTSDSLTANVESPMTLNSTFGDIGLTSQQELEIVSNGEVVTITVDTDTTIEEFTSILESHSFACDLAGGTLTITGKEGVYISAPNATLFNLLNITENTTYDTEVKTGYSNGSSNQLFADVEATFTAETTFAQLGVTTDDNLIKIKKDDVIHTITIDSTDTVGTLVSQMTSIMGEGSVEIRDGKFYINANEKAYLTNINSNIASALKLATNILGYSSVREITTESTIVSEELNTITEGTTSIASTATKLGEIIGAEALSDYILDLGDAGSYTFDANTSIQNIIDTLEDDGITATLGADGKMTIVAPGSMSLGGDLGTLFAGATPDISSTGASEEVNYSGAEITYEKTTPTAVTDSTKLSDLVGLDVTPGVFDLVLDNVTHKIELTTASTIGTLKSALQAYGVEAELVNTADGVVLEINYDGDIKFETSTEPNASNIVEKLFNNGFHQSIMLTSSIVREEYDVTTQSIATESTLLSDYDNGENKSAGELVFNVDGEEKTITITSDDTFGNLIDKLADIGVTAVIWNGSLKIDSLGDKVTINEGLTTSKIVQNLNIVSVEDIGLTASDASLEEINQRSEYLSGSVAEFASYGTKLSMLGITSGTLSIYRDGVKASVDVDANGTFEDLQNEINKKFSDVDLRFNNGYLEIYSTTDGIDVRSGASVDTSNITAIIGLNSYSDYVRSSRELYTVNGDSKLTTSGLFKLGDVTEGTFVIGDATFTIDENTTLNDVIAQINSSAETNATAYWDAVDGKFVIKSRTSGSCLINIEAGTSNFTDIVGFTSSEWNPDGTLVKTKLLSNHQELGGNAEFSINGTNYTSTSNIVGSDVTKIKGLTLDLKGVSNGETVTVTVEKDYNTAADAMQEVVDAYNALIENVDKELFGENGVVSRSGDTVIMSDMTSGGNLKGESTLKLLRNQIRSLMMSSIGGASQFKTLSSIGITTEAASANNISTANINKLEFNKEKFIEAFRTDTLAVEHLLVGNGVQDGILTKVENIVENSVKAVTGYFSSTENSFNRKIDRLDDKIEKANAAVATYKSRLEQKFQYMDMMIAKMQDQFSAFLGT